MKDLDMPCDEQEARAAELEAIGLSRWAARVRRCGVRYGHTVQVCRCRWCPSCARVEAARRARWVETRIRRMTRPLLALITLPSRSETDLKATLSMFRKAIAKLRRRVCMCGVRSACGVIETKLAGTETCWAVHVHLTLDCDELDVATVATAWRALTNGRGKFQLRADAEVDARFVRQLARYVSKADTWNPRSGELRPGQLWTLVTAVHGVRLPVAWGFRRRRRTDTTGERVAQTAGTSCCVTECA